MSDIRKAKFAELIAQGYTQADAYRAAYPKAKKWKPQTVYNKAVILAKEMLPRITELRDASTSDAIMSAREAKETLTKIARNHIDMREKILDDEGVQIGERDVPNRDRIAAIDRLAKMQGWDAAEKSITQVEVVSSSEKETLVTKLIAAQMRLKSPQRDD